MAQSPQTVANHARRLVGHSGRKEKHFHATFELHFQVQKLHPSLKLPQTLTAKLATKAQNLASKVCPQHCGITQCMCSKIENSTDWH